MTSNSDERPQAKRVQTSFLARLEKPALNWIARRLPRWVNPDVCTFFGLAALLSAGIAYYLAGRTGQRWLWLSVASAGLAANWLGDGLDGGLARLRRRERPMYGYHLDHLVDAFGVSFVLLGMAYSGMVTEFLCVALLVIYLIMCINSYLATHSMGVFKLSFARFSPTEGRLALIALNVILCFWVEIPIAGHKLKILDLTLVGAGLGLLFLTLRSAVLCLTQLDQAERARWPTGSQGEAAPTQAQASGKDAPR